MAVHSKQISEKKHFTLFYQDDNTLILTALKDPETGRIQKLHVIITQLRPNLFMVNWQEANKLTNTDIEDFENGVVYANMTTPSDNFVTAKCSLCEIRAKRVFRQKSNMTSYPRETA